MSAHITATAVGAIHDLIFRPIGLKPMNINPIVVAKPCTAEAWPAERGKYQTPVMQRNAISAPGATPAVGNAGL
jgi:hypothetical protein